MNTPLPSQIGFVFRDPFDSLTVKSMIKGMYSQDYLSASPTITDGVFDKRNVDLARENDDYRYLETDFHNFLVKDGRPRFRLVLFELNLPYAGGALIPPEFFANYPGTKFITFYTSTVKSDTRSDETILADYNAGASNVIAILKKPLTKSAVKGVFDNAFDTHPVGPWNPEMGKKMDEKVLDDDSSIDEIDDNSSVDGDHAFVHDTGTDEHLIADSRLLDKLNDELAKARDVEQATNTGKTIADQQRANTEGQTGRDPLIEEPKGEPRRGSEE